MWQCIPARVFVVHVRHPLLAIQGGNAVKDFETPGVDAFTVPHQIFASRFRRRTLWHPVVSAPVQHKHEQVKTYDGITPKQENMETE